MATLVLEADSGGGFELALADGGTLPVQAAPIAAGGVVSVSAVEPLEVTGPAATPTVQFDPAALGAPGDVLTNVAGAPVFAAPAGGVTAVTAVAPLMSSGGATPAIGFNPADLGAPGDSLQNVGGAPVFAPQAGNVVGSAGYVIFRPGTPSLGQAVATWAEVQAAVLSGGGKAIQVIVDSSLAAAHVPAGTNTDVTGVTFTSFRQEGTDVLNVDDTAVLLHLAHITGTLTIVCACTTTAALDYTLATPILTLDRESGIKLGAGATVPMFTVPSLQFFTIIDNQGILLGVAAAPAFFADAGATLVVIGTDLSAADFNASSIGSAPGAAVYISMDAALNVITFTHAAVGTVTWLFAFSNQATSYGQGTAFPVTPVPRIGQPFFRTDFSAEYTWDGAAWVLNTAVSTEFVGAPATFAVPPGVVSMFSELVGGGGGGGGGANGTVGDSNALAGGGGGGGALKNVGTIAVTPGDSITVTPGTGGAGGGPASTGSPGSPSTVVDITSIVGLWAPGASGGDSGAVSGFGGQNVSGDGDTTNLFAWGVGYGSQSAYTKILANVGVTVVGAGAGADGLGQDGNGTISTGGPPGADGASGVANAGGGGGGGGSASGGGVDGNAGNGGDGGVGNDAGVGGDGNPGESLPGSQGCGGGGGGAGGNGSTGGGAGGSGGNGSPGYVRITWVI